jgi:hypothetical protein
MRRKKAAEGLMIPKEFFNNATSDDLRFLRRWKLATAVVYVALTVALVSFAIHARRGTIDVSAAPDASNGALARQ